MRKIEMSESFYDRICIALCDYETEESESAIHEMYVLLVEISNSYAQEEERSDYAKYYS